MHYEQRPCIIYKSFQVNEYFYAHAAQFSSVVLFHDLACIENITYKNRGQEKGRSSKTIYVKTCRVSAWLLHHINTHQTLITTRIHIKQSRKTHKTDAKKKKNGVYVQFRVNYFNRPATHLKIVMLIICYGVK